MCIARVAATALLALVTACGEPVPMAKADYVGTWQGTNMFLAISADGHVSYVRQRGAARTDINAPIQRFEGDDFIVGALGVHTRFVVSAPPHRDDGSWKMTVDGVELTRDWRVDRTS